MKYSVQIVFILLFIFSPLSFAAKLNVSHVEKKADRYILHIEAQINASADKIEKIITDYENLTLINPYLLESNILSISKDNRTTVNMLSRVCILFVCYNFRQIQVFYPKKNNIIYGRIIPEKSDFKQGWSSWAIRKEEGSHSEETTTRLIIDTEMVPDFFILPVIGTYHLKKKIIEIATTTINNLEKKAQN